MKKLADARLLLAATLLAANILVPQALAADDPILYGCNINGQNGIGGVCDDEECEAAGSMVCGYKWCTPVFEGCTLQGQCECPG